MKRYKYDIHKMTNDDLDGFFNIEYEVVDEAHREEFENDGYIAEDSICLSVETMTEDELLADARGYAEGDDNMTFEEALDYIMERVVEV